MTEKTLDNMKSAALKNLAALMEDNCLGDGIVVGLDEIGENLVQIYWATSKDEDGKNRVFGCDQKTGRLYTEPVNPSDVRSPSRVIYNAMRESRNLMPHVAYVVGNGVQTDRIADECRSPCGDGLFQTMATHYSYKDGPNLTSRISAVSGWRNSSGVPIAKLCALRKSPWGHTCDKHFDEINLNPFFKGLGYCITSSSCNDDPSSFRSEPVVVPIGGDIRRVAATFWSMLDRDSRVAIAVKFISRDGASSFHVINKYSKKSSEDD